MALSPGGQSDLRRLDLGDAIHDGWRAFCRAPWSFVGFALLLTALQILLQPLQDQVLRATRGDAIGPADWLLLVVGFTLSFAVSCWGTVGMVRAAWGALAGERPTFASLLRWDGPGFQRVFMAWMALSSLLFVPVLLFLMAMAGGTGLALMLERGGASLRDASLTLPILLVGVLLLLLLGLVVAVFIYCAVNQQCLAQIALLEDQGAMAAVQRGRRLLDPQWPLLLLLLLIKGLVLVGGVITFGLGLLVAWPVSCCITTAAYRQLASDTRPA